MKFQLVDRILSLEASRRIVTVKSLSLAEEYLADHFPAFPVLPGVLMVQAMVESASWLVRLHQDFSRSIVVLSAARNVRYGSFVQPGQTLRCEVEAVSIGEAAATFKGEGFVCEGPCGGGGRAVSARLELRSYSLAERHAYLAGADAEIVEQLRARFRLIGGPEALAAARG